MFKNKKSSFQKMLEATPEGHMLVTDRIIAVPMPGGRVLAITGNFKGISSEEANLKFQDALAKLQ